MVRAPGKKSMESLGVRMGSERGNGEVLACAKTNFTLRISHSGAKIHRQCGVKGEFGLVAYADWHHHSRTLI